MQTFTTSSSRPARADTSTIDFAVMPGPEALYAAPADPALRVPLAPDSFTVGHAQAETPDAPLPRAEISVVSAANPEDVLAVSPLTEVEGMGADGVELGFVHGLGAAAAGRSERGEEGSMIKDLWKGLMEDVFGEDKKPRVA